MEKKDKKYIEAIGRRKTSSARVRIQEASKKSIIVNERDVNVYFPTKELQKIVHGVFEEVSPEKDFTITVKVSGGGIHSQSEAVRHGIARAIVDFNAEYRGTLKKAGFLKRDSRAKERRKFGLKKARKAPKWSKR